MAALGRTAEAEGEKAIWQDLRARLYVGEAELKAGYAASPDWLKPLMDAWAAGLNYYLAAHPDVKPRVLTRFEPWMALSFTEGSIGGDIEKIDLKELERFYGGTSKTAAAPFDPEPRGSNGIAIAPPLTRDGKALLLINPHTSFFFRSEQQVTSDEGLNAYGAATWGQFFIYQGFNPKAGWMHTSSGVDNVDEFAFEVKQEKVPTYRFGSVWRPMTARPVTIRYRATGGKLLSRSFTTWRTHRGPIVRSDNGRWIAIAMMDRPVQALQQSFLRTKAPSLASFLNIARLQANSSNTPSSPMRAGGSPISPAIRAEAKRLVRLSASVDGSDRRPIGAACIDQRTGERNQPAQRRVQNTTPAVSRGGRVQPGPKIFRDTGLFGENYRGNHAYNC